MINVHRISKLRVEEHPGLPRIKHKKAVFVLVNKISITNYVKEIFIRT